MERQEKAAQATGEASADGEQDAEEGDDEER
jgi:hypothetical protein